MIKSIRPHTPAPNIIPQEIQSKNSFFYETKIVNEEKNE